jgi:NADH dehydrogenase
MHPGESMPTPAPSAAKGPPRIVIVGAGFGGLACAQALGNAPVLATIVDRRNYHLFTPLLYQVATAALSPADIAQPVRRILSRYGNIDVLMDEVTEVDFSARRVMFREGQPIRYDRLVVATGSQYAYFGHDEWAAIAPGMKTIEDAQAIRAKLLRGFEMAELSTNPARQKALTTTIVVGGGPTGVEVAGAAAELARHTLARDFHRVRPESARVILVEAGPRILPGFPEDLAAYAERALEDLGVTVWTGRTVEAIDPEGATIAGERIAAGTIVWGAGVRGTPLPWLPVDTDRSGRVPVASNLSVPGLDGVYVIGDLAILDGADGKPLPGLAQVADQQGRHLGKALVADLAKGTPVPAFRFRDRGNTATIGRNAAIFDFGQQRLKGRIAWVMWAIVHVYLLVGFTNRVSVTLQWFWRYITYARGARLILERRSAAPAPPPRPPSA